MIHQVDHTSTVDTLCHMYIPASVTMFGLHLRSSSPPTSPGYLPPGPSRRSSAASSSSRSCKNLDDDHTRDLWHCMLDLQERYACYHSARIDVAMEAGDRGDGYMRTS